MDTSVLEDIGLTKREIKIYVALLEEGSTSAGKIIEKANVQNSVFHFCINRLIRKGLVGYVKKGTIRIYSAAKPEQFVTYLKDKEEKVTKLIPELRSRQYLGEEKQEAEMFEGKKGVITALLELINDSKKGDEFLFFTADTGDKERDKDIQKFYEQYHQKRKARGLIVKGVAPRRLKPYNKHWKDIDIKYTDMPMPANHGICNDKIVMISWGEKPIAVLIKSKRMVDQQKEFFNAMWEKIK